MKVSIVEVDGWHNFREALTSELEVDYLPAGKFLFRGMASSHWNLTASLDRRYANLEISDRLRLLREMLSAFRREFLLTNGKEIEGDEVALQALGQHYGLPSRLLDWSESPYIAAYFAFEDLLTNSLEAEQVAIWALDRYHEAWSGDFGCSVQTGDESQNERLRRQLGHFTFLRAHVSSLEAYCNELPIPSGPVLWQFVLSADDVLPALADLQLMGITGRSLFPDMTGLVRSAVVSGALTRHSR